MLIRPEHSVQAKAPRSSHPPQGVGNSGYLLTEAYTSKKLDRLG